MAIYLLTDFGLADEFAGILHAVLAAGAPGVDRVDITHGVRGHDVRAGALTLWRAAPWLAGGVVLAVVDPGVGTERRAVALRVDGSGATTYLVGPDNGLLMPAAGVLGEVIAAVELAVERPHTFAGRDTFAPAAAALAAGRAIGELGRGVAPSSLIGRAVAKPVEAGGRLAGEVLWVDRYGNAQLNASPADIGGASEVEVEAGRGVWPMRVVRSYGAIAPDDHALVVDSYGLLAICADRRSAAAELVLAAGDPVGLRPLGEGGRPAGRVG